MRDRIGYLHIPKAAGSSGTDALVRAALESTRSDGGPVIVCTSVSDRSLFGTFDDFASFADKQRSMVFEEPVEQLADFDVIVGHFNAQSLAIGRRVEDLVVLLREPRARLVSLYTFWRSWSEPEHACLGTYEASRQAVALGWRDFVTDESIAPQTDNVAARLVLGPHPLVPLDGFIRPEDHAVVAADAVAAMARFGHADVIENGDECWSRLGRWAGLDLAVGRRNETPSRPPGTEWMGASEPAAATALRLRTAIDHRLWVAAAARHGGTASESVRRTDAIALAKLTTVIGETDATALVDRSAPTGEGSWLTRLSKRIRSR